MALSFSSIAQLRAQSVSCSVANKVYVAPGQMGQARVVLNNWDKQVTVNRVSYTLTVDGVTGEERDVELEKPLAYDGTATLTVQLPPASRPGVDDFMVTIVKVNGEPNRYSYPMSGSERYTLTRPVWRKAVIEELTAMWCAKCPVGIASLEHLNRVASDRVIGLAAHNGDALSVGDYYDIFRLYPGRPKIVLNGRHVVAPYFGNSGTPEQPFGLLIDVQKASGEQSSAVQVKVQAAWAPDGKGITVRSAAVYRCPVEKNKYRMAYALTADSLKHPSFVQFNNEAGDSIWLNSVPEMKFFFNSGREGRGLAYNDVVLAATGVRYGLIGSLPEQMKVDTLYEHSTYFGNLHHNKNFNYVKNKNKVHVVALLIDPDTREIVNAERCTVGTELVPFPTDPVPTPDVEQIVLPDSLKPQLDNVFELRPQITPAAAKSRIVWEVADPSVVEMVAAGQFRALRPGETVITARADDARGAVARCVVRVSAPTAIDQPKATTTVRREGNTLVIEGAAAGQRVEVYDLSGLQMATGRTRDAVTRLRVGQSRMWLVVVGGQRFNVAD